MDCYQHPADIPVKRALAVHAAMHNTATIEHWDAIDEWVSEVGLDKVLEDIARILAMNGMDAERIARELTWWKSEIIKPAQN